VHGGGGGGVGQQALCADAVAKVKRSGLSVRDRLNPMQAATAQPTANPMQPKVVFSDG